MEFTPKEKPCCHPYSPEHPMLGAAGEVPRQLEFQKVFP
jgi:hypothetical protein